MQKADLEVKARENLNKPTAKQLRAKGSVPAIIYGVGIKNIPVIVDPKKLEKIIGGEAGRNVIISLKVDDGAKHKAIPVLMHDLQRDIFTDCITHVDFLRIDMEKEIKAKVHVEITGISIGVKEHEGILVAGLREVEVKCLPTDIPNKFVVDVTPLDVNGTLHVSDLRVPEGVEILSSPDETLAHISPPAKEEELAPAPEIAAADVPSEKGAPGEEVPVEGEKKGAEKPEAKAEAKGEKKPEAAAPEKKKEEKK